MADSKKKAAKARKTTAKKTGGKARPDPVSPRAAGDDEAQGMLAMSGLMAKAPWCGASTARPSAAPTTESRGLGPGARPEPVRAPIDRRVPAEVFTVDRPVRNPATQQVVLVLRRPLGFPAGMLPGDPGAVSPAFGSAYSICHVLAPGAALRCAMRGRYG